ncbi:MAG TPA: hypothetical protein VHG09_03080, partial [Longimicrobiales bacterium]|nr:hypothetical protein [Longimicrobiales bacterium]
MRITATIFAAATALAASVPAAAQVADTTCRTYLQGPRFVGAAADLARLVDLQDSTSHASFVLRRSGRGYSGNACAAPAAVGDLARHLGTAAPDNGVRLLAPELLVVGNSAYPRDWNDGVLWGGRGLNTVITVGAEVAWSVFSAAVAPAFAWQSNREFDIQPNPDTARSEFAYRWRAGIDAPQRFGAESFTRFDPGQSFARVDVRGFGAGVSTENIQWGPMRRNPILLSGTAGGFTHAFIETQRPVDIWIGDLEFQAFWGQLEESDYFDDEPDNDRRMLAGLLVALQPRVLDGLTIGGGRLQAMTWWPELSTIDLALKPYRGIGENPRGRGGDN